MQDTNTRIHQALARVPWLQGCSDAAIADLRGEATLEHAADGLCVAWRNRHADCLLIVEQGFLDISMTSAQGKRHFLNRLGPGEAFGLIAVLEHAAWVHDAEAHGLTSLVRIPGDRWRECMRAHHDLNEAVLRLLCLRLRRSFESQAAQALTTFDVRLARALLLLCREPPAPVVAMSQAELADMLGTTRQSLNLELKRLERNGLVALGRNRIAIADMAQLTQLAGHLD